MTAAGTTGGMMAPVRSWRPRRRRLPRWMKVAPGSLPRLAARCGGRWTTRDEVSAPRRPMARHRSSPHRGMVPNFAAIAYGSGTRRVRAIAVACAKRPLSRQVRRLVQSGTRFATSVTARPTRRSRGGETLSPIAANARALSSTMPQAVANACACAVAQHRVGARASGIGPGASVRPSRRSSPPRAACARAFAVADRPSTCEQPIEVRS